MAGAGHPITQLDLTRLRKIIFNLIGLRSGQEGQPNVGDFMKILRDDAAAAALLRDELSAGPFSASEAALAV